MVKRPTSVLLADLVKSSAHSESLSDADWEEVRADFASAAADIISESVNCYKEHSRPTEGDSVVAYLMSKDAAIEMALALDDALGETKYNQQRRKEGKPPLTLAVAIHHGNVPFGKRGPEGYTINLTSKILKKASEMARKENASKILATEEVVAKLGQSSRVARKIETFPIGPLELPDMDARPRTWEIRHQARVKRKMPSKPAKVKRDEELVRKYLEKGHPIRVELQVIDVDIQANGNAFVTDTRQIRKEEATEEGPDEIYFGVYDSPDHEGAFTKELFALQVRDGDGSCLREKWHESTGTIKRFGVYLGRTMAAGETMVVRATMFIPQLFDLRAKKEYFDLDIWDPTDKAIVRLRFPPGLKMAKKTVFEYVNGRECPHPEVFTPKFDPVEERFVVSYVYRNPRVESTYYFYWKWKQMPPRVRE